MCQCSKQKSNSCTALLSFSRGDDSMLYLCKCGVHHDRQNNMAQNLDESYTNIVKMYRVVSYLLGTDYAARYHHDSDHKPHTFTDYQQAKTFRILIDREFIRRSGCVKVRVKGGLVIMLSRTDSVTCCYSLQHCDTCNLQVYFLLKRCKRYTLSSIRSGAQYTAACARAFPNTDCRSPVYYRCTLAQF